MSSRKTSRARHSRTRRGSGPRRVVRAARLPGGQRPEPLGLHPHLPALPGVRRRAAHEAARPGRVARGVRRGRRASSGWSSGCAPRPRGRRQERGGADRVRPHPRLGLRGDHRRRVHRLRLRARGAGDRGGVRGSDRGRAREPGRLQVAAAGAPRAPRRSWSSTGSTRSRAAARAHASSPWPRCAASEIGRGAGRTKKSAEQEAASRGARSRRSRRTVEPMHLRSISLKGFKSFPDRTKLEFTPGVSVIVGPERLRQVERHRRRAVGARRAVAAGGARPVDAGRDLRGRARAAVAQRRRGGGRDRQRRRRACRPSSREISIVRKLDRYGEGEYRLNGARCRLVDVIEVLSDTGLGKEMHSVVSQGRVEAIIHSKPRDRRMLIEEAAGLGKHRKRRRRGPAEAGAHAGQPRARARRGARGALAAAAAEAPGRGGRAARADRAPVARGAARAGARRRSGSLRRELASAEGPPRPRRAPRATRRSGCSPRWPRAARRAEQAFAAQSRVREALSGRVHAARSAFERIGMRLERARDVGRGCRRGRAHGAGSSSRR